MMSRRDFLKDSLYGLSAMSLYPIFSKIDFGLKSVFQVSCPACLPMCLTSSFPIKRNDPTAVKVTNFQGRKTSVLDYFRK